MNSISRYTQLKQTLLNRPNLLTDAGEGTKMLVHSFETDEGRFPSGSRVDNNPDTVDTITIHRDVKGAAKGAYRAETFIEKQEYPGFWATLLGAPPTTKLFHLARTMSPSSSGYQLADVVLQEYDRDSGAKLSESKDKAAIAEARALENSSWEIPRLYLQSR